LEKLDKEVQRAIVVEPTSGREARLYLTDLQAVGTHNAHNAGTAALIVLALDMGVEGDDIQAAIPYLQPPPHRMEVGKCIACSIS
jgi:UDP-N-acetylmuramyl tripeptide synthase